MTEQLCYQGALVIHSCNDQRLQTLIGASTQATCHQRALVTDADAGHPNGAHSLEVTSSTTGLKALWGHFLLTPKAVLLGFNQHFSFFI